jgi:hypothetical protein
MPQDNKRKSRPRNPLRGIAGCFAGVLLLVVGLGIGSGVSWLIVSDSYEAQTRLSTRAAALNVTESALNERQNDINQTSTANSDQNEQVQRTATANVFWVTGIAATADAANRRSADLRSTGTQQAQRFALTQAALNNQAHLLEQTAIQSARNIEATRTARAVNNARQQTQVALDYAATQSRLQQSATQVELDFRATQAAIDGDNLTFGNTNNATATPTIMYTLTSSPSPTPTATPDQLQANFSNTLDRALWRTSGSSDWRTTENGLQAGSNGAWVLSQRRFTAPYTITAVIEPAFISNISYTLLLSTTDDEGVAVITETSTLEIASIAAYRFDPDVLTRALNPLSLPQLAERDLSQEITGNITLSARIEADTVRFWLEDAGHSTSGPALLTLDLDAELAAGSVGVQLPVGAVLRSISIQADS